MPGVTVSYSGVHQAYQIARAADEEGLLDKFFCSLYNDPKCFGGKLAAILGQKRLASRRVDGLDISRVEECPWPLLWHEFSRSRDWLKANDRFDRYVAKKLGKLDSTIFVGVETCAQHSFAEAKKRGMLNVLDCPGIEAEFLDQMAQRAASEFGLRTGVFADSPDMRQRKVEEHRLADIVLACSDFQVETIRSKLSGSAAVKVVPLWIDTDFWRPARTKRSSEKRLRVLFAGKISIRKGIPYLLQAIQRCNEAMELSLIGSVDPDMELLPYDSNVRIFPSRPKQDLLSIYQAHDVFVMPSLGDAFGTAALEAMACGLPVIVSEHCGIRVPNESWRVPTMNSNAIAERLDFYANNKDALKNDSEIAAGFAAEFTTEKYRAELKKLFEKIRA
jgi:glycosyltransferase involved in cell wall biosynthesis